ncbi:patatin-like phospholipase family protein [Alkalimarinus alittae]|uniref:Patatin-like phospholipase family protein n=1 Tax=Alkalimarinus alittae TaxID=2961619 RepID=A0ABY6MYA8_9ALTE|nr:patatin-like phospholipase family protein [Alkalimarinus alittae]UZE94785.1 patatin-like phospholipase family protein [Alkalimarinus alittae]
MTLRDWLAVEPFTLSMSSGFFSFFTHAGMLAALEQENLLPSKVTGSSAGALVGACWASGCSSDELKERLFSLQKSDFWDPAIGFGLLKGRRFRALVAGACKVKLLQECSVPVTLSVFDLLALQTTTFSDGSIQDVVSASCAFPLLFQPVCVNNRYYLDGGIKDRPGLQGVKNNERVFYHHITSRSPWRTKNSAALKVPIRDNMQCLAIEGLPRVGPGNITVGREAYKFAMDKTLEALDAQLT